MTCEKKIVVPVQLCVLSTGYAQAAVQQNAICTTFPPLYPNQIRPEDTQAGCGPAAGARTSEESPAAGCQDPCDPCDDCCCDDDDFFETECPNCGETLVIDESVLDEGVIQCPNCKQKFALDLSDDCCCGDEDEDDCGCGCGCEDHDHED